MGGHIIRPLVIMGIPCIFRCKPVQPPHYIIPHFRSGIFLNA